MAYLSLALSVLNCHRIKLCVKCSNTGQSKGDLEAAVITCHAQKMHACTGNSTAGNCYCTKLRTSKRW
jgi:hypothetical protein